MPINLVPQVDIHSTLRNWFGQVRTFALKGEPIGSTIEMVTGESLQIVQSHTNYHVRVDGKNGTPATIAVVTAGFDGQKVTIEGMSNSGILTFQQGTGLQLKGGADCPLGQGDVLTIHYTTERTTWIENYRSINN